MDIARRKRHRAPLQHLLSFQPIKPTVLLCAVNYAISTSLRVRTQGSELLTKPNQMTTILC